MKVDWKKMHKQLGCYGCHYADKKALGKGAVCTYPTLLEINPSTGCCEIHKEEKTDNDKSEPNDDGYQELFRYLTKGRRE